MPACDEAEHKEMASHPPDLGQFKVDAFFGADDPYHAVQVLAIHNQRLHSQFSQVVGLLIAICEAHGGAIFIPAEIIEGMRGLKNIQWVKQESGAFVVSLIEHPSGGNL
jgi:hypothetical protein